MAEGDLCACYNAADVGVMPGKLGGMKEILGVGRPLIAPDHLATAYLVERENGLTASRPMTAPASPRAMLRYAESPGLRKRHGEKISKGIAKSTLLGEPGARQPEGL